MSSRGSLLRDAACWTLPVDQATVRGAYWTTEPLRWWVSIYHGGLVRKHVEAIVSFETIEHLLRPWDFLEECRRLLQRKGKFIISTPNRQMSIFQENPYHVREYRPQEFVDLLHCFFPPIKKIYGQMFRSYPKRWLSRVTAKAMKQLPGGRRLVTHIQERFLGAKQLQHSDLSLIDDSYKVTPVDSLESVIVQPHFIICLVEV
jgi:hypothetical protein